MLPNSKQLKNPLQRLSLQLYQVYLTKVDGFGCMARQGNGKRMMN